MCLFASLTFLHLVNKFELLLLLIVLAMTFCAFFEVNATQEEVTAVADRHQPFVVIYGKIDEPRKVALFCESTPVLEVNLVHQALIALFALHSSMNYEYSAHVFKPLQFLQQYWLKIPCQGMSDSAKELSFNLK